MHLPKRKRILLAEGNLDTGAMLLRILTELGYEVVVVITLGDGVKELCKQPFDVLIASQNLDGFDRGNLLIAFANGRCPETKTILLSGKPRPANCRADAYIYKIDAAADPALLEEEISKPKLARAS